MDKRAKDLRGFLEELQERRSQDFVRVTKPVSSVQEPTALLRRLELQGQYPVVWFDKVGDHTFPLVMNIHATR
jgi:3-polyprenyl-4-hydroxybenzoate decarboxylase